MIMNTPTSNPAAKNTSFIERARKLPVAVLSDALDALGLPTSIMDATVRRISGPKLSGVARTVDRMPATANGAQADIDAKLGMGTQLVLDSLIPGEVVVIAARGGLDAAMIGDNMAHRAQNQGAAGFVTDGAIRDVDELASMNLAIYAAGAMPRQAYKRFVTLSIDQPIVCGSVRVCRGDLVVGDADGIIVIDEKHVTAVLDKAEAIEIVEAQMKIFINAGNSLVAAVEKYKQR